MIAFVIVSILYDTGVISTNKLDWYIFNLSFFEGMFYTILLTLLISSNR